jgi:hypothetical protein
VFEQQRDCRSSLAASALSAGSPAPSSERPPAPAPVSRQAQRAHVDVACEGLRGIQLSLLMQLPDRNLGWGQVRGGHKGRRWALAWMGRCQNVTFPLLRWPRGAPACTLFERGRVHNERRSPLWSPCLPSTPPVKVGAPAVKSLVLDPMGAMCSGFSGTPSSGNPRPCASSRSTSPPAAPRVTDS